MNTSQQDIISKIRHLIREFNGTVDEKVTMQNIIKLTLHDVSPLRHDPVDCVLYQKSEKVHANDYNPNSVAKNELRLLYTSILHDGYTQPIVTVKDEAQDLNIIVDGFHRNLTMKMNKDLQDRNHNYLPVVVIQKDINDRMASTVRHNRARGKHAVTGMANMVFEMLENGWDDSDICKELGMEAEELLRLKHITGFSKLFEDVQYSKAWETNKQIRLKKEYADKQTNDSGTIAE